MTDMKIDKTRINKYFTNTQADVMTLQFCQYTITIPHIEQNIDINYLNNSYLHGPHTLNSLQERSIHSLQIAL